MNVIGTVPTDTGTEVRYVIGVRRHFILVESAGKLRGNFVARNELDRPMCGTVSMLSVPGHLCVVESVIVATA